MKGEATTIAEMRIAMVERALPMAARPVRQVGYYMDLGCVARLSPIGPSSPENEHTDRKENLW